LNQRSLRFIALIPACTARGAIIFGTYIAISDTYIRYLHSHTSSVCVYLCNNISYIRLHGINRRRRIKIKIEREREREKNYVHWDALNGNAQITVFILYV